MEDWYGHNLCRKKYLSYPLLIVPYDKFIDCYWLSNVIGSYFSPFTSYTVKIYQTKNLSTYSS